MAEGIELIVHADDTQFQHALARAQIAAHKAIRDIDWARTHTLPALAHGGRGVRHDPACAPRAATVQWTADAYAALWGGQLPKDALERWERAHPASREPPTWADIVAEIHRVFYAPLRKWPTALLLDENEPPLA